VKARRHLHGLAGRLALVAASVLGCLALGELAMRVVSPRPVTPEPTTRELKARLYGWAPTPGQTLSFKEPDTGEAVSTQANSQGWRDVEHTFAKPRGRVRILFIGDSFTYGSVPLESVYTRRVEAKLRARGDGGVEVIAIGVGGWGPDQELEALRNEGIRYGPDIVVYQFCSNDVINLDPPPPVRGDLSLGLHKPFRYRLEGERLVRLDRASAEAARFPGPWGIVRLLRHSTLFRSIEDLVPTEAPTVPNPRIERITSSSVVARFGVEEARKPWSRVGWRLLEALVGEMNAVARAHGAKLVVFSEAGEDGLRRHLLRRRQMASDERGDFVRVGDRRLAIDLGMPLELLRGICERQGIPLIAPRRDYERFRSDWHATRAGNESMADDIVEFLANWPPYRGRVVPPVS
jgi:hypothetical protein